MAGFTNKGIKKGLLVDWSQITSIPGTVLDIAGLGDPGGRRFVVWNDTTNHLDYLDVLAADIPYDNSGSGLASTNVQDAIDEIVAFITSGGGTIYAGYVAATAASSHLPAGWSASNPGTGRIKITHNLGLATANDLSIAPSFVTSPDDRTVMLNNLGVNDFEIVTVDVGSGVVDRDVFFLAKKNV